MTNKELKIVSKKIVPILKRYGVTKAGIFGSFARGESGKKSDIDILIDVKKDLSLLDLIKIKMELEKTLKRKVDLVEYNTIKSLIKKQILNEEIRII